MAIYLPAGTTETTPGPDDKHPSRVAYCSVAYSNFYHGDRNHTAWTNLDDTATTGTVPNLVLTPDAQAALRRKEAALLKATAYCDARWRFVFRGTKPQGQQLEWPRKNAVYEDGSAITGIPDLLKQAICEYALRALTSPLVSDQLTRYIHSTAGGVSGVSRSQAFRRTLRTHRDQPEHVVDDATFNEFPEADLLLEPLLSVGSGNDGLLQGRLSRYRPDDEFFGEGRWTNPYRFANRGRFWGYG